MSRTKEEKTSDGAKLFEVRMSNEYKQPTIKGGKPRDKKGNPLPVMVLCAFSDTPEKKEWQFYGDEAHVLTEEEYNSACFLKVPISINKEGRVINPNLVIKEVS